MFEKCFEEYWKHEKFSVKYLSKYLSKYYSVMKVFIHVLDLSLTPRGNLSQVFH